MPWVSRKQRRWAYANKPEMARRWDREYGPEPVKKPRPPRKQIDGTRTR